MNKNYEYKVQIVTLLPLVSREILVLVGGYKSKHQIKGNKD